MRVALLLALLSSPVSAQTPGDSGVLSASAYATRYAFQPYVTPRPAPEAYRRWLTWVEQCSGFRLPFPIDSLTVLAVGANGFLAHGGGPFLGYAYFADRTIAVVEGREQDSLLVSHELLHLVLHPRDGHPDVPWTTPCGLK